MEEKWLAWAREMHALAINGLTYCQDVFDIERYERLKQMSEEIFAEYAGVETARVTELLSGEIGYQTPKLDVRAVVFQDGKLLMAREKSDGGWAMPGGWIDIGKSPFEMVTIEAREETGYEVRPERLLALFDLRLHPHGPSLHHIYKVCILCEVVGGEPTECVETSEVGWFGPDELPELSVSRNTEWQLQQMFAFLKDPGKPVLCD